MADDTAETGHAPTLLQSGTWAALALVDAVDETWLFRQADAEYLDLAGDPDVAETTIHPGGSPEPTLLVYDRTEDRAWIQSDEIAENVR